MKRWQVRFTAVPLKPLFDQDVILSFFFDNLDNFICFPAVEIAQINFVEKTQLKIICFQSYEH